jgi:hypothetical protein
MFVWLLINMFAMLPPPIEKKTIEHVYHAFIKRKSKYFKTSLPWLWFQKKLAKLVQFTLVFVSPKKFQAFYF